MSIITLQFGQCGNQIGQALYLEVYNDIKTDVVKSGISKSINIDYITESISKWFRVNAKGLWEVRSILIDTEDKVAAQANKNIHYIYKSVVAKSHGGCANNWAYGYSSKSNLLMVDILDSLRKEIEKSDLLSTIMYVLGSAGGTGSGIGSKTVELIREEFPNKTIVGNIVLPYKSGEIVTQSYNTLLTLSKLYDVSDAIFLHENDILHRLCSKSLALANITFQDINLIIAQQLATALQPAYGATVSELIANLTGHDGYKLIQIRSVPHIATEHRKFEATSSWSVLTKRIKAAIKTSSDANNASLEQRRLKCIGNVLVSRGNTAVLENDIKLFADPLLYVPWVPLQVRLKHYHQHRNFKDLNKFLTLLTNNNYASLSLAGILEDARLLYSNGAYLHHYDKYGIHEDYFIDAFTNVQTIFEDYNKL